ncbi:hypothetical protein [Halodesulfovibrio sp. MK-HDV]|uniref:Bbp19 family protein n=1 Tax=Halodesulfovibrio sp. MK-HDV TaxID=2599925 RepID=UPI00136A93F6|nr:hypothetical protein [Halodesulfovibrio sp. MK-HDV]KAF1077658.1 hypothetical protein MKHDV_00114 [Halodesulfovibrio sp. MK-HDV]
MRNFRKKQGAEKPLSDETRQAIRRALSTPDGKELLEFLKVRGGVDRSTYQIGKEHEAMIHHGARKALVKEVISIMEA